MDDRRHRLVQRRGWDRAAAHYEQFWLRQLTPVHDAALAAAELAPGDQVLDVACGSGGVTVRIAAAVAPDGCVVATDLSPVMAAATAARAEQEGVGGIVTARCCDAEGLAPLTATGDDGPFDVAVCNLGLMYVPDPIRALREIHRFVRPGARVVASVWGERERCAWADLFGIVDARVDSDVCPRFFALGVPGALTAALTHAGFADVEERRLSTRLRYVDDDEAIGAAFLGGPVALAHARFSPEVRHEAHIEYLASIAPHRSDTGAYQVPAEFVVATAHRP
jgi:SAM-dependent methyltransferase